MKDLSLHRGWWPLARLATKVVEESCRWEAVVLDGWWELGRSRLNRRVFLSFCLANRDGG